MRFVEFLLDTIESPPAGDEADALPDVLVKLLLAFNVHFDLPSDNLVMLAVAGRGTAKTLTEKLMLLFNREGQRSTSTYTRKWSPIEVEFLLDTVAGNLYS